MDCDVIVFVLTDEQNLTLKSWKCISVYKSATWKHCLIVVVLLFVLLVIWIKRLDGLL